MSQRRDRSRSADIRCGDGGGGGTTARALREGGTEGEGATDAGCAAPTARLAAIAARRRAPATRALSQQAPRARHAAARAADVGPPSPQGDAGHLPVVRSRRRAVQYAALRIFRPAQAHPPDRRSSDERVAVARGAGAVHAAGHRANRLRGEHGQVFADRYHAHVLRTPTEVKRAVAYVLDNHRKHAREHGRVISGPDWFSSAVWRICVPPTTWLLASARSTGRPPPPASAPGRHRMLL